MSFKVLADTKVDLTREQLIISALRDMYESFKPKDHENWMEKLTLLQINALLKAQRFIR